jgi:hypothetical protein
MHKTRPTGQLARRLNWRDALAVASVARRAVCCPGPAGLLSPGIVGPARAS